MNKTDKVIPKKTIRGQFSDLAEADWEARDFLTQGLKVCISRPIDLKWINLEGDVGCVGVVTSGDDIVATATVLYDRAGGAMVAGVIFGSR